MNNLVDVQYEYLYRKNGEGKEDVSIERYVFDGELSWAKYTKRETLFPDSKGELIQGFNGKTSWATLDEEPVTDEKILKMSDFLRKTNFYWFAMMPKLSDPGINYKYKGTKEKDGIQYDIVEISYESGVGDVQDIYLLYLNPNTHLVDQFLFTVMDFGLKDPLLMTVEYEEVEGLWLPTKRKYIKSNWEGEILGDAWVDEISTNVKFNNGFDRSTFSK